MVDENVGVLRYTRLIVGRIKEVVVKEFRKRLEYFSLSLGGYYGGFLEEVEVWSLVMKRVGKVGKWNEIVKV